MSDGTPPEAPSVLIVDDDDDQRFAVAELFRRAGMVRLAAASDGDAALRVASSFDPDLVVLDLVMPGRSGLDVLPQLRALVPRAQVVVLSNLPRRRLLEAVRRAGATGYVEKRTQPQRLVRDIMLAATVADAVHVSERFEPDSRASGGARRFVRSALDSEDETLVSALELLVSELVTNAVLHAGSAPSVDVIIRDDCVRVEVLDTHPSLPTPRAPDAAEPSGRGLAIVDHLADRWSTELLDEGKIVWFEIDRSEAPPSPSLPR